MSYAKYSDRYGVTETVLEQFNSDLDNSIEIAPFEERFLME